MRVVLDTNVVLSALLFEDGRLAWLRDAWRTGEVIPVASTASVAELVRVLSYPKFRLNQDDVTELLSDYLPFTETVVVPEATRGPKVDDPHDQKFVDLAVASKAITIVSGDRHLLAADGVEGLKVLRPVDLHSALTKE